MFTNFALKIYIGIEGYGILQTSELPEHDTDLNKACRDYCMPGTGQPCQLSPPHHLWPMLTPLPFDLTCK